MLIHDEGEAATASGPGERALALAIEMVCDGREEVSRYLGRISRSAAALREARVRLLAAFAERPANRGVLLRALALIDSAIERLDEQV